MLEILKNIDEILKEKFKEEFGSLNESAGDSDLLKLREKCFAGKDVPEDLITLFKWHNGQNGHFSIHPEFNQTFLSIDEVIKACEFLNNPGEDILQPWSKSWIPLFYNGAGDYIVYESEGPDKGTLISYWHDDEDRDTEYESLKEWAEDVLDTAGE